MNRELCFRCDKSLSKQESAALSELERRYSFILCPRCLKKERREIDAIIADLGRVEKEATEVYQQAIQQQKEDQQ